MNRFRRRVARWLRLAIARDEFDSVVAGYGRRRFEGWSQPERDLVPGTGLAMWRGARLRRPGVAGANLVLEDLNVQLALFLAELHEQLDVELCQPNQGHYRFAGDRVARDRDHEAQVRKVSRLVVEAVKAIDEAADLLGDRWATWPMPVEVEED